MKWSTTLFSIRGIAVKVHATFALIVAFGALQWSGRHGAQGAAFGAGLMLALFACVLLHELGHSLVARAFGLQVRQIVLLPIGGIATLEGKPKTPKQEIAIALAGPAVNLAIAGLLALGLGYFGVLQASLKTPASLLVPSSSTFLVLLASSNLSLALFNLLPFFPLDGGRVLRALLTLRWGEVRGTVWAARVGQVAGVGLLGMAVFAGQLWLALISMLIFLSASREGAEAQLSRPLKTLTAADVAEVPALEFEAHHRIGQLFPFLLRSQQQAFPVILEGQVLGVVLREELLGLAQRPDSRALSIRTAMRHAPQIESHLTVERALEQLRASGHPVGLVVSPEQPLGLLSAAQVYAKLAQAPKLDWTPSSGTPTSVGLRRSEA